MSNYLIVSMCCCVICYHISGHTFGFTTFQFIVVFGQLRRKSPLYYMHSFFSIILFRRFR